MLCTLYTITAAGNLPDPAFATALSSAFGAVTPPLPGASPEGADRAVSARRHDLPFAGSACSPGFSGLR